MNYIHQDYLPRVTSAVGSWFSKAAYALRRKTRRTAPKPNMPNNLFVEDQTAGLHYLSGQLADYPDQRAVTASGSVRPPRRNNSVLNRYVHTQYKLASYRRMHTRPSSAVPLVPYS